jgi:hypothetical protein
MSVKTPQSRVTDNFKPEAEKPIAYIDRAFACAAIEWLIDADLVNVFHVSTRCTESLGTIPATASVQPTVLQEDV